MPEFLGSPVPVATLDNYDESVQLGPAANVSRLNFSNLGDKAILAQFWKPIPGQEGKYTLEQFERFIAPQAIGLGATGVAGVRFRNQTPGNPSLVTAELAFETDPQVAGGGVAASAISAGGTIEPIVVGGAAPDVFPVYVPDPGAGVSTIELYTVPTGVLTTFALVSYEVFWDPAALLGDRAVLYSIVDPNGGGPGIPDRFVWAQSGNVIYTEGAAPNEWLETDVGTMGNFLRTINSTIAEEPFGSGLDFEQASAPFGNAQWPEGFGLRLEVPHMAGTDEIFNIRLLVSEVQL